MSVRFEDAGDVWEAHGLGIGAGVSAGARRKITRWDVDFVCISDRARATCAGHISQADPRSVSEEELLDAFERALIRRALMDARAPMTAAEIAAAARLPVGVVELRIPGVIHQIDVVIAPLADGQQRYAAR